MNFKAFMSFPLISTAVFSLGLMSTAGAHGDHSPHNPGKSKVSAAAILQLEDVRQATSRYLDVDAAVADGYIDIGAFVPGMGWHYLKPDLVDGRFDLEQPELLVYADDACGGKRKLVAVEYAVPLPLSTRAPKGFNGRADVWDANQELGLWTLHAWIWEYNTDGVFTPHNPRVP